MARKHLVENRPQPSEDDDDYTSEEDEETSLQEVAAVNLGGDHKPIHEEAEEDDDDDESDDEEEAEDDGKDKTLFKAPAAVHQDNSDSESDSDSGCNPPSPSPSQFRVKPIVSKPAESKPKKTEKKQKIKSLDKVTTPVQPAQPPVTSVVEDPKKNLGSVKLWNEEDEITVLKGMITFKAEKGFDPFTDLAAFYDFIKGSLLVLVSKSQLSDKAKRLRKKYKTNVEKGRNGEDPVFTKPHEQKSFDISKKIWGPKANSENSNTTTDNVNPATDNVNAATDSGNVNSNSKVGNKRKAKTSVVSVNGGGNEVAGVATVLALPIKESNVGSSVGVSGKKQKTVTKKEKEKEVANGEGNELLKMKEKKEEEVVEGNELLKMKEKKEEEVVEDLALVSVNHSTNLYGLNYGKLEEMFLDNLAKTENDKANELKKKWSEFQMDELKLYIRRTELLNETATFVLDGRKP